MAQFLHLPPVPGGPHDGGAGSPAVGPTRAAAPLWRRIMSRRSLLCGLAALALLVWTAGPALADHTHEGKVVKVDGTKLTMTDKDAKEHSHDVPATAKVLDEGGKEIKLGDLKT